MTAAMLMLQNEIPAEQQQAQPLTAQQIDELIANYEHQDRIADESRAIADKLKDDLIAAVRAHGSIPEGASQSWRLAGVHSTATVTIGTTKLLRDEAIGELNSYMVDHGLLHLFAKMFHVSLKFTLIDGARDVLNGVDLPKRTREKVLSMFGMCLEVKDKKPSLKVDVVKPEKPARKPRTGKAAA